MSDNGLLFEKQDYDTATAGKSPTNHKRELRVLLTQMDGDTVQRSDQKVSVNKGHTAYTVHKPFKTWADFSLFFPRLSFSGTGSQKLLQP